MLKKLISYSTYNHEKSTDWVTFIHGAGGSSNIWFKQIRDFQKQYNVLLVDLRGHGESQSALNEYHPNDYTFEAITNDIIEVLDFLKIQKTHFIGISLGTILIRQLAKNNAERIKSMVLGGAILKMNFRSKVVMLFGNIFKYIIPYMILYKLFAFIIMPKKNHRNARILFANEAKKLDQKEFIKWFKLTSEINPLLKSFREIEINIPTLYVMGEQDYMFLPTIKKVVQNHEKNSRLEIIESCGHVVNVEKPLLFNKIALEYISTQK